MIDHSQIGTFGQYQNTQSYRCEIWIFCRFDFNQKWNFCLSEMSKINIFCIYWSLILTKVKTLCLSKLTIWQFWNGFFRLGSQYHIWNGNYNINHLLKSQSKQDVVSRHLWFPLSHSRNWLDSNVQIMCCWESCILFTICTFLKDFVDL